MQQVLAVSDLLVQRGKKTILNRISWQVHRGESWVILGANGSGKTSLLSALTGYLTPSEGEIHLLGETFGETDWRDLRTYVGIVSSSILQRMPNDETPLKTVISGKYAMIDYWGKIKAPDVDEARRILREVEAEHLEDRPWLHLSQGERQRVLIGRALMAKPKVLILDEPCSGLDPVAREHFLRLVERLASRSHGPTIIFVTHHVEEIRPIFTHVLLLANGEITAQGPIKTVLTSAKLTEAFGHPIRLSRSNNQYRLTV